MLSHSAVACADMDTECESGSTSIDLASLDAMLNDSGALDTMSIINIKLENAIRAACEERTEWPHTEPQPADHTPLVTMIETKTKIPSVLSVDWRALDSASLDVTQSSLTPIAAQSKTAMHFYALRVTGVRCERHIGFMTRTRLPEQNQLPPLFIYPHGITQREVQLHYQGELLLTARDLDLCELFHLHSFDLTLNRSGEFPSPLTWRAHHTQTDQNRNYLLVPCECKSEMEIQHEAEDGAYPQVGELDEFIQRDDEWTTNQLQRQAGLRMNLCDGRPHTQDDNALRTSIDWAYMRRFVRHFVVDRADPAEIHRLRTMLQQVDSLIRVFGSQVDLSAIEQNNRVDCGDKSLRDWLEQRPTYFCLDGGRVSKVPSIQADLLAESDDSYKSNPSIVGASRSLIVETPYNHRLYLYIGHDPSKTPRSPFPNHEFASYIDYFQRQWPNVKIKQPNEPLIQVVNFALTPINALQPQVQNEKKRKKASEPLIHIVSDALVPWRHATAEFVHLLRLTPCIFHRLESQLLQYEFRVTRLRVRVNPYALAMSLTAANAQENFPIKPTSAQNMQPDSNRSEWDKLKVMPNSYERLKFIGDSILKMIMCKILLIAYPNDAEESITRRKGELLNMNQLALAGIRIGVPDMAILYPFHPDAYAPPGYTNPSSASSPAPNPQVSKSVIADMVSSLVAAAWLSQDGEAAAIEVMCAMAIIDRSMMRAIMGAESGHTVSLGHRILASIHERFTNSILPLSSLTQPHSPQLSRNLSNFPGCESMLAYHFVHPMLLVQAFTHASWEGRDTYRVEQNRSIPIPSYERIELLGDAVLDVCVSTFIYYAFPWCYVASAGDLTFVRQRLVNNNMFVNVMVDQGLHQFILHTSEALRASIDNYVHARARPDLLKQPAAPKQVADAFEGILGGVYIDSGFSLATLWDVFARLVDFDVNWPMMDLRVSGGRARRPKQHDEHVPPIDTNTSHPTQHATRHDTRINEIDHTDLNTDGRAIQWVEHVSSPTGTGVRPLGLHWQAMTTPHNPNEPHPDVDDLEHQFGAMNTYV